MKTQFTESKHFSFFASRVLYSASEYNSEAIDSTDFQLHCYAFTEQWGNSVCTVHKTNSKCHAMMILSFRLTFDCWWKWNEWNYFSELLRSIASRKIKWKWRDTFKRKWIVITVYTIFVSHIFFSELRSIMLQQFDLFLTESKNEHGTLREQKKELRDSRVLWLF